MLERIQIAQFRNLKDVALTFGSGVNWVVGANAAGKTALLEAIYCLSRGRSFRGRRFGNLVAHGAPSARVEGRLHFDQTRERIIWASDSSMRASGRAVGRLPVRLICEWTHCLVDGEPALRRRFVDWNLTLLDRRAVSLIAQFRRVSAQRNAWLRSGGVGRPVWDQTYAESLAALDQLRGEFFRELAIAFEALARASGWFAEVRPVWNGLNADADYIGSRLREMKDRDCERGFTYLGASRADYSFQANGERWFGSRGQGKVVGALLQIAAEKVIRGQSGRPVVWLVDDLDAELAPEWAERLLSILRQESVQLVVTSLTGKSSFDRSLADVDQVFHVEQGSIRAEREAR